MKQKYLIGALIVALVALSAATVLLGGGSAYDFQSLALTAFRLVVLVLFVSFILRLKCHIEGDDLDADWKRIDDGNVATGIYRGLEFAGLVVAGAMLISKV